MADNIGIATVVSNSSGAFCQISLHGCMSDNFLKSICFLKMVDVVPERAAKIRMLSATAQPQPLLL